MARRDFKKLVRGSTPAAHLIFPHLQNPNTKFKAEGEFQTSMDLFGQVAADFIKKIEEVYETEYAAECQSEKKTLLRYAGRPYGPALDKDKQPIPGATRFRFSRKAGGVNGPKSKTPGKSWTTTIPIWSADLKPVTEPVWGGTLAKVSYTLVPWFTNALGFGIRLQLEAVQVFDLVTQGERAPSHYGFEVGEGYSPAPAAADAGDFDGNDLGEEEGAGSVDF